MNLNSAPTAKWATTISFLGIGATIAAAWLTGYGSQLATKQSAAESCIQRVDKQEMLIREKAEALLSSIAGFAGDTAVPGATEQDFHASGNRLVDSAMRFSAYAPRELTEVSYRLAGIVQIGLMAKTEQQQADAFKMAKVALTDWPIKYYGLMDSYAERRNSCLN